MKAMSNAQHTVTETCGRCNGTGHYSYNQTHGTMCYGCMGCGTVTLTAAQAKTRTTRRRAAEAREATAQTTYAANATLSNTVLDRLLAAWGAEFAAIPEAGRRCRVADKARVILAQRGVKVSTSVGDLAPHLDSLGV